MKDVAAGTPIEIWFQDEMRIGQKNGCVRQWATRGSRPRQPADQRYQSAYVFGAVCPARDTGAALVLPFADTEAMQKHIDEIALAIAVGSHAVILLDNAGWHRTKKLVWPKNLSPLFIPACCPELNSAENIWQYMRQTWLSNRVFPTYDAILSAASDAWNKLLAETGRIMSIATRSWAISGQ